MVDVNRQNLHSDIPTGVRQYLSMAGLEYEFRWIDTSVSALSSVYIRAKTSPDKYTLFNARKLIMDQSRGFYRAFTGFTGGGPTGPPINITPIRLDTAVPSAGIVELFSAPTSIDQSTKATEIPLFGVLGQGNQPSEGDRSGDADLLIIPPDQTFLIEFQNASASASYFQANLRWFEVSPGFMPKSEDV